MQIRDPASFSAVPGLPFPAPPLRLADYALPGCPDLEAWNRATIRLQDKLAEAKSVVQTQGESERTVVDEVEAAGVRIRMPRFPSTFRSVEDLKRDAGMREGGRMRAKLRMISDRY